MEHGWRDLLGDTSAKTIGLTSPTLNTFRDHYRGWFYGSGNRADITYHIPHDYAPGTDLFIHVHWAHNGEAISGLLDMSHHVSYAMGHSQMKFSVEKTVRMVVDCNGASQYLHRIDEIQISSSTDSALLDTKLIEPDGVITNSFVVNKVPLIVNGDPNLPMIIYVDVHYQSTDVSTKNKVPNFYE